MATPTIVNQPPVEEDHPIGKLPAVVQNGKRLTLIEWEMPTVAGPSEFCRFERLICDGHFTCAEPVHGYPVEMLCHVDWFGQPVLVSFAALITESERHLRYSVVSFRSNGALLCVPETWKAMQAECAELNNQARSSLPPWSTVTTATPIDDIKAIPDH